MQFYKGKKTVSLLFSKQNYVAYRQRVKLYNKYLLPILLMCLCFSLILFHNRDKVDVTTIFVFSTFAASSLCGILLFKLSDEKSARQKAESSHLIAAKRLASIYDASIVGLLYTRFDGVILKANDAFLDIIGYDREDLENGRISWIDMTPPEYAEVSQLALVQLKASGACEPFVKEYIKKDGKRVHVLLGSSLLTGDDQAQIFTYAVNITNLKEAEKREHELTLKMQNQQEQMFRILNNAPIAIVIRKGPELKTEYANQTALNYTTFNDRNIIGTTADAFHQELKTNYNTNALTEVYRTGKPVKGNAQHVKYDRFGTGDLQEGWFDYVWEPIFDEHGNVEGVVTFTFEVSDIVLANKELIENEQRFRFIADAIPHKMWTSGPTGRATYYNKGWIEYLQEENVEKLRAKAWQCIHPDELEMVEKTWNRTVENGLDMEIEQRLRRHDGVYQWHLTRVCACKDKNDRITMFVGSSTNIHDQKMADIAVRLSSDKKDEFLGIATHELRTPITSMKAALQSLERSMNVGSDLANTGQLITLANRQVNKLAGIVNDLVDVNRIQSGKLQLNKSQYLLSESVRELIIGFEHTKQECKFEIQVINEARIYADRIRIEQVILNLLSNAIKYSEAKGPIKIIIESNSEGTKCIVIDKGIGIPNDLQPYVFDRFFRVHASSQLFSGLGLGLYISSGIIKQHDGTIGVDSVENKGSSFWFHLPVTKF